MPEINDIEKSPEGIFPINLKWIDQYQQKDPSIMAKYNMGTYNTGYFCGESNIYLNLITCTDNVVILSILQSYVLYLYHMYILHPEMDISEAMICQHLYWPVIRNPSRSK